MGDETAGDTPPDSKHAPGGAGTKAPTPSGGSPRRLGGLRLVTLAVMAALAAGLAATAWRRAWAPAPVQTSGQADIGGPFHLVDQDGRPADQRILVGKWSAVFFGYTGCPDTCPATLQALAAAQTRLSPRQRAAFQVVFISVDPARDTPAQMKLYLSSQGFPSGAVGLTGGPSQVAAAAKAYRVFYQRQGSGPAYAVQHSAAIYLMDPRGGFAKPLDETQPPASLADQIRTAMAA